jgi:hypothetical protein
MRQLLFWTSSANPDRVRRDEAFPLPRAAPFRRAAPTQEKIDDEIVTPT